MADERRSRMCGSCGAAVAGSAVTCPSCGALLAAYEAPAGSTTADDTPSTEVSAPVTIPSPADAPDASEPIDMTAPEEPLTPEPGPVESMPDPAPFDAAAPIKESRRTLGMSPETHATAEVPAHEAEPHTTPDEPHPGLPGPEPEEETLLITSGRRETTPLKPDPVPDSSIPSSRVTSLSEAAPRDIPRPSMTGPSSVGGGSAKQPWAPTVAPDVPAPTRPNTANLLRIATAIPILMVVCWMLVMLDFSNFMVLVFVVVILFNMIKFAARFSGRKSTTMSPPERSDR